MNRPSRSVNFEVQYLANAQAWDAAGGPPCRRVFQSAARYLGSLQRPDRFLLWIDSFAFHEPWDRWGVSDRPNELPPLPLFPAYAEAEWSGPAAIASWRSQYARRLSDVDLELAVLVDRLEVLLQEGDVALAVLSDHGFLFGEFGFVGKPQNTPLPPSLHDIVCWLSDHFRPLLPSSKPETQPHILHDLIRRLFEIPSRGNVAAELQVFGRNSPRSSFIAATRGKDLFIGTKGGGDLARFSTASLLALNPALPLASQAVLGLPTDVRHALKEILAPGRSPWLVPFQEALRANPRR